MATTVEMALADRKDTAAIASELDRLERMMPELLRAGGRRRGEVYLNQNEAWDFIQWLTSLDTSNNVYLKLPALPPRTDATIPATLGPQFTVPAELVKQHDGVRR